MFALFIVPQCDSLTMVLWYLVTCYYSQTTQGCGDSVKAGWPVVSPVLEAEGARGDVEDGSSQPQQEFLEI